MVGVPDADGLDKPVAYVVPRPGARIDEDEHHRVLPGRAGVVQAAPQGRSRSASCPRPAPGRSSATGCARTRANLLQLLDVRHRRRRISPMVSFDAEPSTYRHWKLDVDGRARLPAVGRRRGRRHRAGLRAEDEQLRPGRRHRALRRHPAAALRAPRVRAVVVTSAKDRNFCAGANIRMLAQSSHTVEGELLQVHQRDPQRHRGRDRRTPGRPGSPRSTAPPRAAATSWRWPATRSCWSTTTPRPSRCPRCRCWACCPAPAASPA